jgi:hypothetical protein
MAKGGRVLGVILIIAVVVGLKFYNRSSSHDEAKARLLEVCEGDAGCIKAVEQHYERCFEASYKMGGRRQSSKFDLNKLVGCLNDASGETYFEVAEEASE